jgi:SWIM zinc finger
LKAVSAQLPKAEHRHCARHIYANWKASFKGDEMKLLFWRCAKAYNVPDFYEAITDMEAISPEAVDAFKKADPNVFCRAYLKRTSMCDVIVSNMVETFNNYIMSARSQHLINMLEEIRTMLMKRLVVKREAATKWTGVLCPKVQAIIDKEKDEAIKCGVHPSSSTVFQVSYYLDTVEVDLERRSCTCRKWDLRGIPCCHAIAAIFYVRKEVETFVDKCYSRDAYLVAYAGCIPPITGERHWPQVNLPLIPPPVKVGPGRPRKSRIRSKHEDPKRPGRLTKHGVEMKCTLCKEVGHNKRGCPLKGQHNSSTVDPTPPPAKRPRGRPKKNSDTPSSTPADNELHHNITAQPSSVGRGGKTIRAGQGVRGAMTRKGATSRGRGKGSVAGRGRGRSSTAIGETDQLASSQVLSTQASITSELQSS